MDRITVIAEQDGFKYTKTYYTTRRMDIPSRRTMIEAAEAIIAFEKDRMKGRGNSSGQ